MLNEQTELINEIKTLKPTLSVKPHSEKPKIIINEIAYSYDSVRQMIKDFKDMKAEMEVHDDFSNRDNPISDEDAAKIAQEDWTDSDPPFEIGGKPVPEDFIDSQELSKIDDLIRKNLLPVTREQNDAFDLAESKRIMKGKVLKNLIEELKILQVKNPREYIRNKAEDFGMGLAKISLTDQEFTWTINAYTRFYENFGDDLDAESSVEFDPDADFNYTLPDSDIPARVKISHVSAQKLYTLSELIADVDEDNIEEMRLLRDRLVVYARLHTVEECQKYKNVLKARMRANAKYGGSEDYEPLSTDPNELLREIYEAESNVEDPNDRKKAVLEKLKNASEEVSFHIGEAPKEEERPKFKSITVPASLYDVLFNTEEMSQLKIAIDNNYPQDLPEVNERTGMYATPTWLIELAFRGWEHLPLEVVEKVFEDIRKEDEAK